MARSDYLELDDPVLPLVKEHAVRHPPTHRWLLESGRHWARREFVRRAADREHERRQPEWVEKDMDRLRRHQVAVLTRGREGVGPEQSASGIVCGFLAPHCNADYLVVFQPGTDRIAGVMRTEDIIELHPSFRLSAWPWPTE